MKKYTVMLAALIVCLVLTVSLAGCGAQPGPAEDPSASTASIPENPADTTLDPDRDWEPIDTKFGTFRYPDQWFDSLETEQNETENAVSVLFRAVVDGQKFDLYELTVKAGDGDGAGTITGPDGVKRDVYVRIIELPDLSGSGLNDGEINRVYAMQESVNNVLDTLS